MSIRYAPRWPLLLTLVIGVAAVVGLTYATTGPSGDALPAQGGRYVEGVAGSASRGNPLAPASETEEDLAELVFAGLVRLGPKGDIQPDLIEALPSIGPDGRTYTFKLRPDLNWHDGARLTASDVVFTIRAIQDPAFEGDPRLAAVFEGVDVEATDERTVVMTLPEPFAPFLGFAAVGILPEHRLAALDAAQLSSSAFFERPVGSGPYRLRELTPSGAVLESYGGYHLGAPRVETFELRFYRDDATLLNALQASEIDGALFRSGLSPENIKSLEDEQRWVRRSLHGTTYSLVYLNPGEPAFQDADVRRALQRGLDRQRLIEEALAGQALPVDSPITPDLWAYAGFPDAYAFDRAEAAALLDDAGWTLSDGVRTKDGAPLSFTLSTIDDPMQQRVAEETARQWSELGIRVDVQGMGTTQFREQVLVQREFDAALSSIRPPGPDPDPYPFWHSTQALGEGLNLSGFSNIIADQLLENARQTPSRAQRAEDYRVFQEIFAQALPAILLHTPTYQYVVTDDLQGLSPGLLFTPSSRFFDVHRWFLETEPPADDDA